MGVGHKDRGLVPFLALAPVTQVRAVCEHSSGCAGARLTQALHCNKNYIKTMAWGLPGRVWELSIAFTKQALGARSPGVRRPFVGRPVAPGRTDARRGRVE